MLDKSKIIEQVKKLLEVNQSNGATEAEEKIALEKANMLIEKYQIEKYQLKSKSSNTHGYFTPKKKYPIYLFNGAISLIAEYFGCIAFTQGKKIIIFGDGEFVNLAIDMAKQFEFEMEIEVQKFKYSANYLVSKILGINSLVMTNSFRNGYCSRVIERLLGFIESRQQNCQKSTGTDLVVLNRENLKEDFMKDFGVEKIYKAKRNQSDSIDIEATKRGLAAGEKFRISEELENGNDA